jgi:hypothetical protein
MTLSAKEVRRLKFYEDGEAIVYRDLWPSERKLINEGLLSMRVLIHGGMDIRLTSTGRAALAASTRRAGERGDG